MQCFMLLERGKGVHYKFCELVSAGAFVQRHYACAVVFVRREHGIEPCVYVSLASAPDRVGVVLTLRRMSPAQTLLPATRTVTKASGGTSTAGRTFTYQVCSSVHSPTY